MGRYLRETRRKVWSRCRKGGCPRSLGRAGDGGRVGRSPQRGWLFPLNGTGQGGQLVGFCLSDYSRQRRLRK